MARCELTFAERLPIDHVRALAQHRDYCAALEARGLEVLRLPADEDFPDCCFVEDAAIVLDELAVLARPGAASRRGELAAVEAALAPYRRIQRIEAPATLDGGDVLQVARRLYVGVGTRTSADGAAALARIAEPLGYEVVPVRVTGCLHLKSAVTALDDETLLANPALLDPAPLRPHRILDVAPEEPAAANVLRLDGAIWAHPGFPRTLERLERAGYSVSPVDVSEFLKAEAALTCKSLLFRKTTASPSR